MDTVTVACKLPNGIILHTYDADKRKIEVRLNGSRLPIHPKTGRELRHKFELAGEASNGVGGYGLTPNVRRDVWEQIARESAETPPFRNAQIFALPDTASARDMSKEMAQDASTVTGMEPVDPDKVKKVDSRLELADAPEAD